MHQNNRFDQGFFIISLFVAILLFAFNPVRNWEGEEARKPVINSIINDEIIIENDGEVENIDIVIVEKEVEDVNEQDEDRADLFRADVKEWIADMKGLHGDLFVSVEFCCLGKILNKKIIMIQPIPAEIFVDMDDIYRKNLSDKYLALDFPFNYGPGMGIEKMKEQSRTFVIGVVFSPLINSNKDANANDQNESNFTYCEVLQARIPFLVRYQKARYDEDYVNFTFPKPFAFCLVDPSSDQYDSGNLEDADNECHQYLWGSARYTLTYPTKARLSHDVDDVVIRTPVGRLKDYKFVSVMTITVSSLAFLYISYILISY